MKAKFVNESLNEGRKMDLINFKSGDCVVITKSVNTKDLNFKKTAETWWGRNIYPIKKEWGNNIKTLAPGDVVFISVNNNKCYKIVTSSFGQQTGELSTYINYLDSEPYVHEYLTLLIDEGYATIQSYDSLDEKFKFEFETRLKLYRMWTSRSFNWKKSLIYEDNDEIIDIKRDDMGIKLSVVDIKTGRQTPDIYIKNRNILYKNIKTEDGETIDGNPFNIKYSEV